MNCSATPAATEGFAGVSPSETRAGAATLRVLVPLTDPNVAVIAAVPGVLLVASPAWEKVTLGLEELQVADVVRSLLVPSLYLPMAVNCWAWPAGIVELSGEIWRDCRTVRPATLLLLPPQPSRNESMTIGSSNTSFFIVIYPPRKELDFVMCHRLLSWKGVPKENRRNNGGSL